MKSAMLIVLLSMPVIVSAEPWLALNGKPDVCVERRLEKKITKPVGLERKGWFWEMYRRGELDALRPGDFRGGPVAIGRTGK